MVKTKVFVGNLSFKVTDTELSTQFAAAGTVVSANIITRGPRSLGYGFVEMQSDEEAQKAIETLNKKEIEGREINVELAKIREDGEQAPEKRPKAPRKRTRKPRGPKSDGEEGETKEGETKEGEKKEAPKKAAPKKEAADGEGESAPRRRRKPRRAKKPAAAKEEAEPAKGEAEPAADKPKRVRKRKPRVASDVERTPSKTTLFVANLPFALTDETFGDILKESNLAFKQAHVVKKYNGRSKGYGFIEFNAEEDQLKALEALNKKEVETRELSVKIAFTELKVPEVEKSEGKEETKTEKKEGEPEKKETAPITPVVTPVDAEATPAADQK